jgi:hypothetical protein
MAEDLNLTECYTSRMTTKMVCVRISEEEKQELEKYGKLSDTLRAAMKLYLNTKKSAEVLCRLRELQARNPIKTSDEEIVRMIREDRNR